MRRREPWCFVILLLRLVSDNLQQFNRCHSPLVSSLHRSTCATTSPFRSQLLATADEVIE